jgi:hypothetical protein
MIFWIVLGVIDTRPDVPGSPNRQQLKTMVQVSVLDPAEHRVALWQGPIMLVQ